MIVPDRLSDPLSDVMSILQVEGAASIRFQAGGVWSLRFVPEYVKFNVVRSGSCWLIAEGIERRLRPGNCFMVTDTPFVLASDPGLPPSDGSSAFAASSDRVVVGTSVDVEILGGSVILADTQSDLLAPLLPPIMVISGDREDSSSITWLVTRLDDEWQGNRPGSRAACNDIIRLLFVQALRQLLSEPSEVPNWLNGLSNPGTAKALKAIHLEPNRNWRLNELAAIAGQSRSAFSERFTRTETGLLRA